MLRKISMVGIVLGAVIAAQAVSAAPRRHRLRLASEVQIHQSQGQLPSSFKQTDSAKPRKGSPEGAQLGATGAGSPTTPVTCNQQNASSPACYSATQQARPVTR